MINRRTLFPALAAGAVVFAVPAIAKVAPPLMPVAHGPCALQFHADLPAHEERCPACFEDTLFDRLLVIGQRMDEQDFLAHGRIAYLTAHDMRRLQDYLPFAGYRWDSQVPVGASVGWVDRFEIVRLPDGCAWYTTGVFEVSSHCTTTCTPDGTGGSICNTDCD
jgi:hypothetical protein